MYTHLGQVDVTKTHPGLSHIFRTENPHKGE